MQEFVIFERNANIIRYGDVKRDTHIVDLGDDSSVEGPGGTNFRRGDKSQAIKSPSLLTERLVGSKRFHSGRPSVRRFLCSNNVGVQGSLFKGVKTYGTYAGEQDCPSANISDTSLTIL